MSDDDEFEPLTLVFLVGGQAILEEGTGDDAEIVWASDDDEDFAEQFPNTFLTEEDKGAVLNYLIDEGIIEEADAADVAIDIESYTPEALNGIQ